MSERGAPTKLVMMIVSDADADHLMSFLVEQGLPATKVGSSGGFLRHGSVTIFSGVAPDDVPRVVAAVTAICHAREEFVPVPTFPFGDESFGAEPIEVRVGGAIVFVLDVERFERI